MNSRSNSRVVAAMIGVVVVMTITPGSLGSDPIPDSVPSFNESPGCDALAGVRGPLADQPYISPSQIPLSHPVYGPWGDFYGRTRNDVRLQFLGIAAGTTQVKLPNFGHADDVPVWVHRRIKPAMDMVIANLEAENAQGNYYPIDRNFTWSYNPVTIPPGRVMSFHAMGAAIDINSNTNPYRADNVLITDMPEWFVDAWRDAGWCWGGDWQSIKDPMHFSWMGPLHTPEYEMPNPQPPKVAAANYTAGRTLPTNLGSPASGSRHAVADMDRDGAADIVRIRPISGNRYQVFISESRSWYRTTLEIGTTQASTAPAGAPFGVVDMTRDGRPDLVFAINDGGSVALETFAYTGGTMPRSLVTTSVPFDPAAAYLFADLDRDGDTDLFVVSSASPAQLTVWAGPGFTDTLVASANLGASVATHRFAVGDRNADGIPDLFALTAAGQLIVHSGAAGFAASSPVATGAWWPDGTPFIQDLDGDGYGDIVLVASDGRARMLRGGASTHEPGEWFVIDAGVLPDYGQAQFAEAIDWMMYAGISGGCNPPSHTRYCPDRLVTRAEMATFLRRAFGYQPSSVNAPFTDHLTNEHRQNINSIRDEGLTVGCSPTKYCPSRDLTRAEIATLIRRGTRLPASSHLYYADTAGHWGAPAINSAAQAGLAWACDGAGNFCPDTKVNRGEMAQWLYRAWSLGLLP